MDDLNQLFKKKAYVIKEVAKEKKLEALKNEKMKKNSQLN